MTLVGWGTLDYKGKVSIAQRGPVRQSGAPARTRAGQKLPYWLIENQWGRIYDGMYACTALRRSALELVLRC